jgi:hypothetical protein
LEGISFGRVEFDVARLATEDRFAAFEPRERSPYVFIAALAADHYRFDRGPAKFSMSWFHASVAL